MNITEGFQYWITKAENIQLKIGNTILGIHDKTHTAYIYLASIIGCIGIILTIFAGYEFTVHNFLGWYSTQSVGIHWTTVSIMCFQYSFISWIMAKHGIVKLRNIIYSFVMAWGFTNSTFEWVYVPLYETIHLNAYYITAPFLYNRPIGAYWVIARQLIWFILGLTFIILILKMSKIKISFTFDEKRIFFILCEATITLWILWVFYPLPFQQVQGSNFPQTLYMIPESNPQGEYVGFYVENHLVHTLNVLSKTSQFITVAYLFTRFKKLNNLISVV